MKRSSWFLALLGAFALLTSFGAFDGTARAEDIEGGRACSKCSDDLPDPGWCTTCKVGHVGDKTTGCKGCFDAMKSDDGGWCDGCKVGYLGTTKTSCKGCFAAMTSKDGGWCDGCKVGYLSTTKTGCKGCFAAMTSKDGAWCDGCKVGYLGTTKTTCKGCFHSMTREGGGWCIGCKVGYLGSTKTKCMSCYEALKADKACDDCDIRFEKGKAFHFAIFHVHGLKGAEDVAKIKATLAKLRGVLVSGIDVSGQTVSVEIDKSAGASKGKILGALEVLGYGESHEGEDDD